MAYLHIWKHINQVKMTRSEKVNKVWLAKRSASEMLLVWFEVDVTEIVPGGVLVFTNKVFTK